MKFFCVLFAFITTISVAQQSTPKNIIMVVGDGMGPAYTTAYRYFADDKSSAMIEPTVFDRHLVGMASTYPARESGYVTDSAASATALSTGHKSYNGAIGLDSYKQPQLTVLEWAKRKGMKTGVAVTSQINHATPASYASHNEYRRNYNAIADSYFDDKIDGKFVLDVMLGGGWQYFIRDDRNLVDEFIAAGYQYVDDLSNLDQLSVGKPVLGLFGDEGLPWVLDTESNTRLPKMVETAITHLENENGYFLLVEGSQIDWAGHGNDISSAMAEMHDFAVTLEWLESYVEQNPDTLVVVTADHSTGGLTIAANKEYVWDPEWLKQQKGSLATIAQKISQSDDPLDTANQWLGFELTEEEQAALAKINIADVRGIYDQLKRINDQRTNTGWTTSGHTAVDVQVFAFGPQAQQFSGHLDNTDIPKILFNIMGKQP